MIVAVGGIKGGTGKTTVATNLTCLAAANGRDVLLIDADDQESAYDFTLARNHRTNGQAGYTCTKQTGAAVRTETLRFAAKYQDIVIDTGGRDTTSQRAAISVAQCLLIPLAPRSLDIWTLEKVSGLIAEMLPYNPDLRALAFLNRADPSGADNADAAAEIQNAKGLEFLDTPLGNRKVFGNAAAEGLAVFEFKPPNAKAAAEVFTLFQHVFNVNPTLKYQVS
jgi:chromosome partitioning protein